jgi:hypothetical protein
MAYIFQTIANKATKSNITPNQTSAAREWFRDAAQKVSSVSAPRLMNDKQNIVPSLTIKNIGQMFMFSYDPKHKDTLPYYDVFPLIFLVDFKNDGFTGINLHYISPYLRAKLMDSLYNIVNNDKYDDSTKLRISYQVLSNSSRFGYFAPCFKRYLWNHVGGSFLNVQPKNWDTALMLPTERFKKANKNTVFSESAKKVQ